MLSEGQTQRFALPVPLPTGGVRLGRGADCDLVLDHPSVSRHHVRIGPGRNEAEALEVEDLGSSNGSQLSGVPLAPGRPLPLPQGASLVIGELVAVLRRLPRATTPLPTSATKQPGEPRAQILATPGLRDVLAMVDRAAPSELPVLIQGETGAGKEHIAERLVRGSPRAARPFLRINVAAMSPTLIESELFGHERGAFTGADRKKTGLFESASGGTVFLDEIGDLPLSLQAKLLRVLEERAVWPVGADRPVPIDVRFLAATHHDLPAAVEAGRFRRDLYYRLCGVRIALPPLRERRADVEPLAEHFLAQAATALSLTAPPSLSAAARAALAAHDWPGNVRELRFACERAVVLAGPGPITPEHLQLESPPPLAATPPFPSPTASSSNLTNDEADSERQRILRALEQCAGNQTQAARLLGISRGTLVARLDQYNLPRPRRR